MLFDSRKARVPSTYLLEAKRLTGLDLAKLPIPVKPEAPFETDPNEDGLDDDIDEPNDERLVNGLVVVLDI